MSRPRSIRGIFSALLLLSTAFVGQSAETLRLTRETLFISERGEVPAQVLIIGTNRLSFLAPLGWTTKLQDSSQTLLFIRDDLRAKISLRVVETNSLDSTNRIRELVLSQQPGATETRKITCFCAGSPGLAIDFERKPADAPKINIRAAYFPWRNHQLEFLMIAPSLKFETSHLAFTRVLGSLLTDLPQDLPSDAPPLSRAR